MYVKILDHSGNILANLTEHIDRTQWTPDLFEGLSFENVNPGGYSVASYTIHRPVNLWWADTEFSNQVIIGDDASVYWEGYIDKVSRKLKPDTIDISCLGWNAQLNQIATFADIDGPIAMSSLIISAIAYFRTGYLSQIVAGNIETGDYIYPAGCTFSVAPFKTYYDIFGDMNAANNYDWGIWNDKRLDFTAKKPGIIDWMVYTGDCNDLDISNNPESLCNWVLVDFTQDGTNHEQLSFCSIQSWAYYGRLFEKKLDIPGKVDEDSLGPANPGSATRIGTTYLNECAYLKASASLTCNRIFDGNGAEKSLCEVRAGQNIRVVDWLPTKETLTGVSDIATFQIKSAKYNHDNGTLAITPTEFLPSVETELARMQTVGY